jgi:hypothetical protein
VLKKQWNVLHKKTTDEEINEIITEHLLSLFRWCDSERIKADELADRVWRTENIDGVVFYSNYQADLFAMRHGNWLDRALEYADNAFGEAGYYAKMKAGCNDAFLVVAFIWATEHYLYDQLGVDRDEGVLPRARIKEIVRLIKTTAYDGDF